MPNVSGGTRRRATAASARPVSSGSVNLVAPCISAKRRFETVTALPPRPRTNGPMHSTCTCPTPSVRATGNGASACAQSTCPNIRWSRKLAHDGSLTSTRSSPASAANPCSRAATSTAQSTSGTNAATIRSVMLALRTKQRGRCDERARELRDLAVLIHRGATQQHIRVVLRATALLHEDGLCLLDDLAVLERRLRLLQLALQAIEGVKPADRHVEDRLDALLT